jgi:hypothetical protein
MTITKMKQSKQQNVLVFWRLLPLFGSVLFILLYIIATLYYPGGTYLNNGSQGFSWTQNYWCNLLSEKAINGQPNPARPIALTAMAVLGLTLGFFWYEFPRWAKFKTKERYIVQTSGFLSMVIGLFVITSIHDTIINVAGVFGLVALTGTLIGLWKLGWRGLFYMGIVVVGLIGLNNLLYYQKNLMYYLAVVQKITFLYFLLWVCSINISWFDKTATNKSASMKRI